MGSVEEFQTQISTVLFSNASYDVIFYWHLLVKASADSPKKVTLKVPTFANLLVIIYLEKFFHLYVYLFNLFRHYVWAKILKYHDSQIMSVLKLNNNKWMVISLFFANFSHNKFLNKKQDGETLWQSYRWRFWF